ncbi:MAG: TIGR02117 family protein [Treponema sp.]|nr:TIGR02117 family protein [Treponema sp.]
MKKIFKITGRGFLIFLIIIGLYFLFAEILSSVIVNKNQNQPKEMAVYISTNGLHADIVMPIETEMIDWSQKIKFEDTKNKDGIQNFVAVGWGNREFFIDTPDLSQLKISIALRAGLGMGPSAMHATFLKGIQEDEFCRKIELSKSQYDGLVNFIESYFIKDPFGNFINISTQNTYGDDDAFYEAKGRYTIFFTCNTWANSALKSAGLRSCLWTPFQNGIFKIFEEK